MITKNEIKYIIKLIKSFENRGSLLKGTTGKTINSEGGLLNLLVPLMKVGLPLMKNVLTPLAKSFLMPLGVTAAASAADARIYKKS